MPVLPAPMQLGFLRNLTPGEIVGQVLLVAAEHNLDPQARPLNLVLHGPGRAAAEFRKCDGGDADCSRIKKASKLHRTSHVTIFDCRHRPRDRAIGKRNAASAARGVAQRVERRAACTQLMPINRKWPIAELLDAFSAARSRSARANAYDVRVHVLLGGVNDTVEDARPRRAVDRCRWTERST